MLNFNCEIVNKPAYRAVGLKWEGPYTEINMLKKVIQSMSDRVGELEGAVNPYIQLGLSYHVRPDGFVHYSVYEVNENQTVPEGMVEINIPEMTYIVTQHRKGQDIGQTYQNIAKWLMNSEYKPYEEPDVNYFDELPIKHEKYPLDHNKNDPHFDILVPIIKKK